MLDIMSPWNRKPFHNSINYQATSGKKHNLFLKELELSMFHTTYSMNKIFQHK